MSEVWTNLVICFADERIASSWASAFALARKEDWAAARAAFLELGMQQVMKEPNDAIRVSSLLHQSRRSAKDLTYTSTFVPRNARIAK
jgi:hypothetical protein